MTASASRSHSLAAIACSCVLWVVPAVSSGALQESPSASSTTPARAGAPAERSTCVTCHRDSDESYLKHPATQWGKDVHAAVGLGCHDCHGGDPTPKNIEDEVEAGEAAMDPAKGFRPPPDRLQVADFCARCHSSAEYMKRFNPKMRVDQLVEYRTSEHGRKNAAGDPVPATCIDCHGSHGIRRVASPESKTHATNVPKLCAECHADVEKMAPYGIPTTQFADYGRSVHAIALFDQGDLSAPACNDCHGNHGAAPPEARSVAHVCGQCHGREAGLYAESIKQPLFERLKVAECITCHGNHLVRHPTPDLFDGRSAPAVSRGKVTNADPFAADLGDLAPGDSAVSTWRAVLAPHLKPEDPRYTHRVEIVTAAADTLFLNATVRPGLEPPYRPIRIEHASGMRAVLAFDPVSGPPVEAGDAIRYRLVLSADGSRSIPGIRLRDLPGNGVYPHRGSACLQCHEVGDSCDVETEKIFATMRDLDRGIRSGRAALERAEFAGMEVSLPQFELKRQGITAAVEARALIHSFDYGRVHKRALEGQAAAAAGLKAGQDALAEMRVRRRGLAVSLVFIAFALVGLALQIRQIDRDRHGVPK
ncbi:MAG TPA: cytochrome c3 family protein [Candidatus Eisenbacteria bacterium]|nr:cytochrome c3 family protein [Candidatus Eisenbacteria bacterium]